MLVARPWAMAVAALGHLVIGLWIWWVPAPSQSGAVALGSGGLELAMGPAGSTAGATTPSEAPLVPVVAAEAAAEPVATSEPVAPLAPPPMAVAATAELPPPPPVEPEAHEMPVPSAPRPERLTEAAVVPPPATVTAKAAARPRQPRPAPPKMAATPPPAPQGNATGRAGEGAAPDAGTGDASAGGGRPGDRQDYLATLAAWLERHKEYPQQARARRQEGVVLLRFTIDRAGRLLNWRIDQGSGYAALDREVEAMLRRATPLPPLPPEMTQAELELAVPIRFRLR